MEAKKDIGKAIREKLDSLDRQPGDALWDAISSDLDKNKKKRFPFFWLYIMSTALVAIGIAVYVLSNLQGGSDPVVTKQDSIHKNTSTTENQAITDSNSPDESAAPVNNNTPEGKKADVQPASVDKNVKPASNSEATVSNTSKESKTSSKTVIQKRFGTDRSNSSKYARSSKTEKISKAERASNKNQAQIYSPVEKSSASTSAKEEQSSASGRKTIAQNNENSQNNSKTAVSLPADADLNNPASDKENTSSSIDTKNIGTLNTSAVNDSTTIVVDSLKATIAENKEEEKKEEKKDSITPLPFKKFSIYAYGGPSYFSFPDRTIVTDSTTSDINTKSTTRFGVMFGYRLTNKLSIRTGFSLYKLKQSASNIKLNYVMGGSAIDPLLIPTPDFTWIDYQQPFGTNSGIIIGQLGDNYQVVINIDRELSYVEIPLEIGYNLYDRRFGLNVFAGGSMLILNKNKVTAFNEKGQMYLGEWNAAEKTSFTGSLGLGLHYKFTPSLQLNTEPVFNYYFNSYKDSKPYSFTFRIGLQYNFDF